MRRKISEIEQAAPKTAMPHWDLLAPAPKRPRGSNAVLKMGEHERATHDAKVRAESGEWDGAKASTILGLYSMCHKIAYGCSPGELDDKVAFTNATRHVQRMMQDHFGGEASRMVGFVKWVWAREKVRVDAGRASTRLGWRLQFSSSILTDYKAAAHMHSKRRVAG
jgi:hypothetical protein